MAEIMVGDRVYYRIPGGEAEVGPGTVTTMERTDQGASAAFVEFDPPEDEDPDGAETGWIDVAYLRRIQDD